MFWFGLTIIIGLTACLAGYDIGRRRGQAIGRSEAVREIGVARKIYGDRLRAAASQLRDTAESLWPQSWNDDQPAEPRGYE